VRALHRRMVTLLFLSALPLVGENANRGMPSFSKLPELQRWQLCYIFAL
jgi:hypothetical protein